MLSFNPYMRPTIEECLSHEYFSELRRLELESTSPCAIKIKEIDSDDLKEALTIPVLKKIVLNEIKFFKNKRKQDGINSIKKPYMLFGTGQKTRNGGAADEDMQ